MTPTLREAGPADLRWVDRAVRGCPVAMAEFGGFYARASVRLPPLLGPGRSLLVVLRDGERAGFLDADSDVGVESRAAGADPDEPLLALAWFVDPAHRGAGLAAAAVALLRERCPGRRLHAAVDADNAPSLATARRAGLVDVGANRWGERVLQG